MVLRSIFVTGGLQQRDWLQLASLPISYLESRCQSVRCKTLKVLPEGVGATVANFGLGVKYWLSSISMVGGLEHVDLIKVSLIQTAEDQE